jgi:single-strand DNA-binding protein
MGHLGKDPEVKTTSRGSRVASFSLATSKRWRDKQSGETRENTEWHRIVVYNEVLADMAGKYLHKGSGCFVEGELQTRSYTGNDGVERYITEIVVGQYSGSILLVDRNENDGGGRRGQSEPRRDDRRQTAGRSNGSRQGGNSERNRWDEKSPPVDDLNDEIPF